MQDFDFRELNIGDRVAFIAAGEWSGKLHHGVVVAFSEKRVRIQHANRQSSFCPYNVVKLSAELPDTKQVAMDRMFEKAFDGNP